MRKSPATGTRSRKATVRLTAVERDVLRQLCRARLTRSAWAEIERELGGYTWQDVEHGLVYAAIERLGHHHAAVLREQLPAQATRMGFPEINWQAYFPSQSSGPRTSNAAKIRRLIRALQAEVKTRISP